MENTGSIEIVTGPMVSGKCLGKGTQILMACGTLKNVEDILSGDFVMGENSEAVRVKSVTKGFDKMYRVKQFHRNFKNQLVEEKPYIVNSCHILSLKSQKYDKNYPTGQVINIEIQDYLKETQEFKDIFIGYRNVVFEYNNQFNKDYDIEETRYTSLYFSGFPDKILYGSYSVRKKWLTTFLEEYGDFSREGIYFRIKQPKGDKEKFIFLVRSLGFTTEIINDDLLVRGNELQYLPWEHVIFENDLADTKIQHEELDRWVNCLPFDFLEKERLLTLKIEELKIDEHFGFTLEGNSGLFMLADFTITHNTSELLKRLTCDAFVGKNVLFINHSKDTRVSSAFSTHNPLLKNFAIDEKVNIDTLSCEFLPPSNSIKQYDTIGIDESQFFHNLELVVEYAETHGKRVIVSGLLGDYKRDLFGDMYKLIPKANKFDLIPASCMKCAEESKRSVEAFFTHRSSSEEGQLVVGGLDKYFPVCRKHFLLLNPKPEVEKENYKVSSKEVVDTTKIASLIDNIYICFERTSSQELEEMKKYDEKSIELSKPNQKEIINITDITKKFSF